MVLRSLQHEISPTRPRHRAQLALAGVLICLIPSADALAHGAESHAQAAWWTRWTWSPLILISLTLLWALYTIGLLRLWRQAGTGHGVTRWQAAAFALAMLSLIIALLSPLDAASEELSAAHMIQHMMLMMIAAPLFILGAPLLVMIWALPERWRHRVGGWSRSIGGRRPPWYLLWQPLLLWALFALTLWIWHLPALYEAALQNELFHDFQHVTFFVAAALFWRVLLDPLSRLRMSVAAAVLYLFLTSLHATVLGVFMALSPRVWYASYVGRTSSWGLSALEDQQLAGLIMWMPACLVYAVVVAIISAIWLHNAEPETEAPILQVKGDH